METTDLIIGVVSTLALLLLLLNAVSDRPCRDGPGHGGRHCWSDRSMTIRGRAAERSRTLGDQRRVWLLEPGAGVVEHVPAELQAEALGVLDTLGYLDALFADGQRPARDDRDVRFAVRLLCGVTMHSLTL